MNTPAHFKHSIELIQIAQNCIRHAREDLKNDKRVRELKIHAYLLDLEVGLINIEANLLALKDEE